MSELTPAPGLLPVDWPVATRVRACITTRHGGVSMPPFNSLNLGDHVGDAPSAVATNRQALATALAAHPVFLQQVHGTRVQHLSSGGPDGSVADACVTTERGLACTVMVADCLPVLLADARGRTVAAAHAGWRGLAGVGSDSGQGVLESVFKEFQALSLVSDDKFATEKNDWIRGAVPPATPAERADWAQGCVAWLGPCIGPHAFEVGAEVRAAFLDSGLPNDDVQRCFDPVPGSPGKYLAHLAALARLRLVRLGVGHIHGNDGSGAWCTVAQGSVWFSHRRDTAGGGSTGRMAACVWLQAD